MTTWKKELVEALNYDGLTFDDVVATTLSDAELNREFDPGFGGPEGASFYLWTEENVYFGVCYDGAESVGSVPRNPRDKAPSSHIGGW